MKIGFIVWALALTLAMAGSPAAAADQPAYAYTSKGTKILTAPGSGFVARILVDELNSGGSEIKIAELTFPVGYQGRGHLHGPIEIFYVLSGRFGHKVNDVEGILEPGQIGIVRPGDEVTHSVHGDTPARVLTIWVPGGAIAPSFRGLEETPID